MGPSRRKGGSKAASARRQWKVGDLVLAKLKGFPAWPATVSEPEKWGYSNDWKKVLVYFFGTKQIAFCNPADVEEFTEEKKVSLLGKRKGRGADFVRAVQEIADCFDKLNEKNRLDKLSSDDAVGELNGTDTSVPDATHDSTLKSSDSMTQKGVAYLAVEDGRPLTGVESKQQRGESEEPADNLVAPSLAVPNTYTLRKKSRNFQPQQCANQKTGSGQRSRISSRFDLRGLRNDVTNLNGGKNSTDTGVNGFWDGPLIKAKRSKRSPDASAPNVGHSPSTSTGNVDNNGSEVATTESDNLSNNEENVIESEHKHAKSETVNGGCVESLELHKRLDFQANAAIVRKKRNPGRKRVHSDSLESSSRLDCVVNKEVGITEEKTSLPSSFKNMVDSKDEGDEHLPLVKRARVRMGKLLSEEEQLDFVLKIEDKSLESASTSLARNVNPVSASNHQQPNNVLTSNGSIGSLTAGNSQVPDIHQQTCLCTVSELGECSPSDSSAQPSGNKPQSLKQNTSLLFGSTIDGESALPPSKRLHRALEAMSANVAEESKKPVKGNTSTRTDIEMFSPPIVESCSNMSDYDKPCNKLQFYEDSSNSNNALKDNCLDVSRIPCSSTCDVITKAFEEVVVSDSPAKDFVSVEVKLLNVDPVKMAPKTDNEDPPGSDNARSSSSFCEGQYLQVMLTGVVESEPTLGSLSTVATEPPLQEFSNTGKYDVDDGMAKNNNLLSELNSDVGGHLGSGTNVTINCHDDINVGPSGGEAKGCAAKDILNSSASEITHANLGVAMEKIQCTAADVNVDALSSSISNASLLHSHDGASISDCLSHDQTETGLAETNVLSRDCDPKGPEKVTDINFLPRHQDNHVLSIADSKSLDIGIHHHNKSGERINLAEVKAALASLELTLGSLTRTKESIGRATRIGVDCVRFGVAAEVVELLLLYLEKEASLYRRVDIFFLVDSIVQGCRGLKGEAGGSYISAVKESLARMLSVAAPAGQAAKDNRRQCLKVLRLWLDKRILPEYFIRQQIREVESRNCPSSGYSRRMSRTERSFDDPLRDMEGMLVDEYGSNSSFQLPGFCMPRMLKEEEEGSDSDGGSFEAVTPEHDSRNQETLESTALPAAEKHRHILEDVDGELEMEDVAPSCDVEIDPKTNIRAVDIAVNSSHSQEQFTSFVPPLPKDVPPGAPPLPSSPPPLPPLPPPPLPPPPPLTTHAIAVPRVDVDPLLHPGRNSMQEAMPSRPPAPGVHHSVPMAVSTSSGTYNSYHAMHNPVPPGNSLQPAEANLYCNKGYNMQPPYPPPSNQFSYHPPDQLYQQQREVPPPHYYDNARLGQNNDDYFYGDHDNARPSRPEMTEGWGYPRPPYPGSIHSENRNAYQATCSGPSCEPLRPQNHGWGYPPHLVHHQNHMPSRPPCDSGVPVGVRGPGYWQPR